MKIRDLSVASLLSGDKHTAALFYRYYAPKLLIYIEKRVQNGRDSEEILQDTLYAFLEGIRDFHGSSSMQTFLFSICQHKVIDYYRRKKLSHILFSRVPSLENVISPFLTPEEEFDAATVRKRIHKTLSTLLPQYREMITLRYFEGLSVSDIAGKLSMTIKSAEMKLFRARKAFVEAFISI